MEQKYTAQRIEDTENGWLVTETETEKKSIVFCNSIENTAEDAVSLIKDMTDVEP
jgi:hypothetical protein